MEYQELQSFNDARVGRDVELLRSELAQLTTRDIELRSEKTRLILELNNLKRQFNAIEGGAPDAVAERKRLDNLMRAAERARVSMERELRLNGDQEDALLQLIDSVSSGVGTKAVPETQVGTSDGRARQASPGVSPQRRADRSAVTPTTADVVPPSPVAPSQLQQAATLPPVQQQVAATTSVGSPATAAAGALLGQRLKARLAAQSVRQSRKEGEGAADEVERARRVTRPSKFAYITIGLMGLSFDVLNWLVSVLVVVDLILAVIFFLSIRAMINRPVKTQQLFAVFLVLFICFLFIPIVGPIFAFPLLAIVLIAGAWNPNAKYSSFDREKLQGALDDFSGSVNKLQNLGKNARVAKGAASKAKSLSTVTSKAPKTTLRLGASAGAEAVPLISWLPLNIMNAVWTFVDMRKGYAEARRLVAQYEQQQEEAADAERASLRAETIANMEYVLRSSDARQLDTRQPVGDNGSRRSAPVAAAPAQQAAPPIPRPVVRDVGPASSAPRTTPAPVGARA